jgi:SAM-dependent methyltransferase
MMLGTRDSFSYAECAACGTLRLLDVPADMSRYYGHGYYSTRWDWRHWVRRHHAVYRIAHLVVTRRLPGLPEWWPPRHTDRATPVLDVGSGGGNLLLRLQSLGFRDLRGIDPYNPADIDYGRGLRVSRQTLEQVQGRFGVVIMNHSFEHMPEPQAVLERVRGLLAEGGVLIIRTPIAGSWAMRHYGADWVQLDAPRHLFVHSERGLRRLAETAGLRVEKMAYDSTALQFWGSEQYRRGVPLAAGRRDFSRREMHEFAKRAEELNRRGEGDQAWFHLSPAGPHV